MCLCVLLGLDLGEDVGLAEHEQILAVDLDLGAAVLRVQDLVALRDVERNALLAVVVVAAVADGDDLALLRLLLGGVGEDDAAGGRLFLLDRPHDEPVAQRLELHVWMTSLGGAEIWIGTLRRRVPTTTGVRIAHGHSLARSANVRRGCWDWASCRPAESRPETSSGS